MRANTELQNSYFPKTIAPLPSPFTMSLFSERWRKLFWLQLIYDLLRKNQSASKETRGYTWPQYADFPFFAPWPYPIPWPLGQIFWVLTRTILIAVNIRPCESESVRIRRNERVQRTSKCRFSFFRSVTLTNNLWVTFSEGWRKLIWLRLIWDLLQANRKVNEEMRAYTGPQNADFRGFSLRDPGWCHLGLGRFFLNGDANFPDCGYFETFCSRIDL